MPRTEYIENVTALRRAQRVEAQTRQLPDSLATAVALGQVTRAELWEFLELGSGWNADLPYFATVVSDEPRKNIALMVIASEALRDRANLIVIGQVDRMRYTGDAPERYPNLHFTGYITEDEKLDLIGGSAGLVFASFSEGFGIPVVEGAIFDKPVICSDIPVFREITGGLATYIDPNEPGELVGAIDAVLDNRAGARQSAERLGRYCREKYRQDAMALRLSALLAELASRALPASASRSTERA